MVKSSLTVLQGTLDLLILQTLSVGPNHGDGVSTLIRQRTDGTLAVEDAALYQGLHRLERQRLVTAEWGLSENNRKAKYYRPDRQSALWRHTWWRYGPSNTQRPPRCRTPSRVRPTRRHRPLAGSTMRVSVEGFRAAQPAGAGPAEV